MIPFLLTPIGRYAAIIFCIVVVSLGIYYKIRADAVADMEAAAQADILRRTQNAIRAGDSVDNSDNGLLKPDRNRRD